MNAINIVLQYSLESESREFYPVNNTLQCHRGGTPFSSDFDGKSTR